jgi:CRISPR-associated protein Cas5d
LAHLLGLEVHGPLACFTRPELKIERLSYPVITPSAARGIFDAVYLKPTEFRWAIRRIEVLAMPAFVSLRRNEVKDVVNARTVASWMSGKSDPEPLWADGDRESLGTDMRGRTQRQTIALRDVRYRLWAEIVPWPGVTVSLASMKSQFSRRAAAGKCFQQPYFGLREFPAYFDHVELATELPEPVKWTQDLGLMLFDVFDLSRPGNAFSKPAVSLYKANVENGVIEVPEFGSDAVLKPGGKL